MPQNLSSSAGRRVLLGAAGAAPIAGTARGQGNCPDRTIRIIVPLAPTCPAAGWTP